MIANSLSLTPTSTCFTGRAPPNKRLVNKWGTDLGQREGLPYW